MAEPNPSLGPIAPQTPMTPGLASPAALQGLIMTLQQNNQTLAAILDNLTVALQALAPLAGSPWKNYTVASLPASASSGSVAWASNGRKTGEGAGTGTGVPVFWNPANSEWYSFQTFAQVTA